MANESPKTAKEQRNLFWDIVNDVRGAFAPELVDWAKKLTQKIPSESVLRGKTFARALGILTQYLERSGGKGDPWVKVTTETVSDFLDHVVNELVGDKKPEKVKRVVADWMQKFFNEAGWRMRKSKNPKEEFEKIKLEFELRKKLLKLMEEETTPEKAGESAEVQQKTSLSESLKQWEKKLSNSFAEFEKYWENSKLRENLDSADVKSALVIQEFRKNTSWLQRNKKRQEALEKSIKTLNGLARED